MSSFNLGDYVDVKERLRIFHEQYPTGSIQFEFKGVLEHNPDFIWGIAYAYRSPDDERPAIGTACELATGKTTFTRGSELMNLETSAWGRAIAALGLGLGGTGIATAQEVEAAKARQTPAPRLTSADGEELMTDKQLKFIRASFNGAIAEMTKFVNEYKANLGMNEVHKLTKLEAMQLIDAIKAAGYVPVSRKPLDPESKD
jgi:hypothetical protein